MTHAHCQLLDGYFHMAGPEHCSQAHCDGRTCRVSFTDMTFDSSEDGTDSQVQSVKDSNVLPSYIYIKEVCRSNIVCLRSVKLK